MGSYGPPVHMIASSYMFTIVGDQYVYYLEHGQVHLGPFVLLLSNHSGIRYEVWRYVTTGHSPDEEYDQGVNPHDIFSNNYGF